MKRILVVKLADLGDVLTATPALRALRNAHPAAHIAALVTPRSEVALRGSTAVDEVVVFDKAPFDQPTEAGRGLPGALRFAAELRRGRWDALTLLHHLTTAFGVAKYAALCLASGAPMRAGLDNGRGWFLTHRARDDGFGARHEVDYWLEVVGLLGGFHAHPRLELAIGLSDHAWADETLVQLGHGDRGVAIVHPGSGGFSLARRWPADRFAAVARGLADRLGLRPLVLHGPAPGELELAQKVAQGRLDLIGPAPSPQALAALLARASLFVGNESGVMHLAAAMETPTVAIFGPTNDRAWGPYPPGAPRFAVVRETLACAPCIHRGHAFGTPEGCPARTCLDLIEPTHVLAAAERVLGVQRATFNVQGNVLAAGGRRTP